MKNGQFIGQRYKTEELVGKGGMQSVHKALDVRLNRHVALKTPLSTSAAKRFESSAQLSARIRHPNIASALDYLVEDEVAYFAEELINGINLQQCFDSHFHRLCPDTTAKILHNLAKGLAASHDAGVIHRDLKPSNIMVSGDLSFTMVKITDFGIARLAELQIKADLLNHNENSATSSTLIGAIPFMAPEAISKSSSPSVPGKPIDVWALGAIAYYLLTGIHPFGPDITAVVGILSGKPPAPPAKEIMKGATHEIASQLWATIKACLAANAADRPTANQLAEWCASMRYLDKPRVTSIITGKAGVPVYFSSTETGESLALPQAEFVYGTPSLQTRVSCFRFPGNPHPRGVGIIELKKLAQSN